MLRHALASRATRICIYGDSKLVVSQLSGIWQCKADNLTLYYEEGLRLIRQLQAVCNDGLFCLSHVYREYNVDAHALANVALDNHVNLPVVVADNWPL